MNIKKIITKGMIALLTSSMLFTNVYAEGETCPIDPYTEYEWKAFYQPGTKDIATYPNLEVGDKIYFSKDNNKVATYSTANTDNNPEYFTILKIDGTKVTLQSSSGRALYDTGRINTSANAGYFNSPTNAFFKTKQLEKVTNKATCMKMTSVYYPRLWENSCSACFTKEYDYASAEKYGLDSNDPNDNYKSVYEQLVDWGFGNALVQSENLKKYTLGLTYRKSSAPSAEVIADGDYYFKSGNNYIVYKKLSETNLGQQYVYLYDIDEYLNAFGYTFNADTAFDFKTAYINSPLKSSYSYGTGRSNYISLSGTTNDTPYTYYIELGTYDVTYNYPSGNSVPSLYPVFTLDFSVLGIGLDAIN